MSGREAALARVLRDLRRAQRISQLELALAMGTAVSYLSKLENGRYANPKASFVARYVDAYVVLGRPLNVEQIHRLTDALISTSHSQ